MTARCRSGHITCPHGYGETDRIRCLDRVAVLLPPLVCLLCPIPIYLIADPDQGGINRALVARLAPSLSPSKSLRDRLPPVVPRAEGLAIAMAAAMQTEEGQERLSLSGLLRRINAIPGVPDLPDMDALRRLIRSQGLRLERGNNGRFCLPVNDRTRAFVRCYSKEAA